MGNDSYFWIISSNPMITIAMSVANNFTNNVRMVDVGSIFHDSFRFSMKFLDIGIPLILFILQNLTSVEYIKVIILSKN